MSFTASTGMVPSALPQISESKPTVTFAIDESKTLADELPKEPLSAHRFRITHKGIDILENYYQTVAHNPTPAERRVLLAQIHEVMGNKSWRMSNLTAWFYRRRRREHHSPVDELLPQSTLTTQAMQHLKILSESQPNPPPSLITTWAALLAVPEGEIKAWLDARASSQEQTTTQHMSTTISMTSLPTPSSSASPPQQRFKLSAATFDRESSESELVNASSISPVSSTHALPIEYPEGAQTHEHLLNAIVRAASERSLPAKDNLPKNAMQFKSLFPSDEDLDKLLQSLTS